MRFKTWIKNNLLTGLIVLVPITITVYILRALIGVMDGFLTFLPKGYHPDDWLGFHMPGLGLILVTFLVFLIGMLARNYFGGKVVHFGDRIVGRIPVVRGIYQAVKQLTEAVVGNTSQSFQKVVMVEFPRAGLYSIGFLAGPACRVLEKQAGPRLMNVFIPCTPNPTTGYYVVVPEKDLIYLELSVEEAFKLIISGGLITPPAPANDRSLSKPIP